MHTYECAFRIRSCLSVCLLFNCLIGYLFIYSLVRWLVGREQSSIGSSIIPSLRKYYNTFIIATDRSPKFTLNEEARK